MEITANAAQAVVSGGNVLFTDTPIAGNCAIIHREGSGSVKLRGLKNGQCRSRFRISFNGNIAQGAGTVGAISLAIMVDGDVIGPSTMTTTPAALGEYQNVAATINLDVPTNCCSTVTVSNITPVAGVTINVQNANLIVERIA